LNLGEIDGDAHLAVIARPSRSWVVGWAPVLRPLGHWHGA
jgi:hypothetical protein